MKQKQLSLHVGSSGETRETTGYAVGNFFVHKDLHYWHIVHLHTCKRMIGDFARRKDAIAVVEAMDSPTWDFVSVPSPEVLEVLYAKWARARMLCEDESGILRLPSLPEDYVPYAPEKQAAQES